MEQIAFFLTEYVGEIAAGMGAFVSILLVTALHRMRRIEKYMQEIAGNRVLSEENAEGQAVMPAGSAQGAIGWKAKPTVSANAAGLQGMKPTESANSAGLQEMKPTESANADELQEADCAPARKLPQGGLQRREGAQEQNAPEPQSPGQLIDEVLGEVFL